MSSSPSIIKITCNLQSSPSHLVTSCLEVISRAWINQISERRQCKIYIPTQNFNVETSTQSASHRGYWTALLLIHPRLEVVLVGKIGYTAVMWVESIVFKAAIPTWWYVKPHKLESLTSKEWNSKSKHVSLISTPLMCFIAIRLYRIRS